VWGKVCSMLAGDCKKGLSAVRAVAAKYRMTNKPAPEVQSPYVDTILLPFRLFCDRHGSLLSKFSSEENVSETENKWEVIVLEEVTAAYLTQVQGLMETVKQMDTALQRRSKLKANAGSTISDSDKISLQLLLDVRAYGRGIENLGSLYVLPSYAALLAEVAPAEKLLSNTLSSP